MTEVLVPNEGLLFARKSVAEGKVRAHFETHSDQAIKARWREATATQSFVLQGASLALAAHNHGELKYLVNKEIQKYKGPSYAKARTIFDGELPDEDVLRRHAQSKPQFLTDAERLKYPADKRREEELVVGKEVLRKLQDVIYFPADDFKQSQKEAARLVAQLKLTVDGQSTSAKQNLKGRMFIIDLFMHEVMSSFLDEPQNGQTDSD